MKLRCIVFDVDGTLVDNSAFCRSMETLFRKRYPEYPLPKDFFIEHNANTRQQNAALLGMEFEKFNALMEENHAAMPSEVIQKSVWPGMCAALKKLRRQGYVLGLNTSRSDALLQRGYRQHPEIFTLFEPACVVTASRVEHLKPAPDSLLYLCETCGLSMDEMLYIGDAMQDAGCARAAGVPFAWAAWGWHTVPPEVAEGDLLLHHPSKIFTAITYYE